MLDDLKKIHERDSKDVLGAIADEWQQLVAPLTCTPEFIPNVVSNVVYAGMGGSAVAALMLSSSSVCTLPFDVVRDYDVPLYVNEQTLFIACSSSGNTEETIEAIKHAAGLGAQIVVIAGGGKLAAIAEEQGYPLILVPKVEHPRFSVFYVLNALVTLLGRANACPVSSSALAAATDFLQKEQKAWLPTVPAKQNFAKQVAQECMGKSLVVYAGPRLASAAYRWKMTANESAKQVAWWGVLPEFNHNEFAGWSGQPEQKPYAVIELRSELDHPRIQKRFEVTEQLLSGKRPAPIIVQVAGNTIVEQLLWAAVLGDFVGAYLAILGGTNPGPLAIVDKFKHAMGEYAPNTAGQ